MKQEIMCDVEDRSCKKKLSSFLATFSSTRHNILGCYYGSIRYYGDVQLFSYFLLRREETREKK